MKHRPSNMERASFERWKIQELLQAGDGNMKRSALSDALHSVMENDLTERERDVLRKYYFEGLNCVQIAKQYGVFPSTVTRTLHRAENRIRGRLKYCLLLLHRPSEENEDAY